MYFFNLNKSMIYTLYILNYSYFICQIDFTPDFMTLNQYDVYESIIDSDFSKNKKRIWRIMPGEKYTSQTLYTIKKYDTILKIIDVPKETLLNYYNAWAINDFVFKKKKLKEKRNRFLSRKKQIVLFGGLFFIPHNGGFLLVSFIVIERNKEKASGYLLYKIEENSLSLSYGLTVRHPP